MPHIVPDRPSVTDREAYVCPDCDAEFAVGDAVRRPRCPVCLSKRVSPAAATPPRRQGLPAVADERSLAYLR